MASDLSRVGAARDAIRAVEFEGKETVWVLSALDALELEIVALSRKRKNEHRAIPSELVSAADYQDAPHGTEVAKRFGSGWWRKIDDTWIDESGTVMPGSHIAVAPREVVKWGFA